MSKKIIDRLLGYKEELLHASNVYSKLARKRKFSLGWGKAAKEWSIMADCYKRVGQALEEIIEDHERENDC